MDYFNGLLWNSYFLEYLELGSGRGRDNYGDLLRLEGAWKETWIGNISPRVRNIRNSAAAMRELQNAPQARMSQRKGQGST